MERNAGVVAAVVLFVAIFAVKQAFFKANNEDATKVAQDRAKQQADERTRHIAGQDPPYLLDDAKEDFSVTFPAKPSDKTIILVGLYGGSDKDWESHWLEDTRYSVRRRTTPDHADELAYVKAARKRMIDHEDGYRKGKPEQWIVAEEREGMFQGEYPAASFEYTYKKYSHQEPMSGRVLIVKVPGKVYYLQVDGNPDFVAGPVTERFFASFKYAPKAKPPLPAPSKQ